MSMAFGLVWLISKIWAHNNPGHSKDIHDWFEINALVKARQPKTSTQFAPLLTFGVLLHERTPKENLWIPYL